MVRYMLLRSRAPTLLAACGIAILVVAVALGKPIIYAVGAAELLGWLGLVILMPRAGRRSTMLEHTMRFSEDGVEAANQQGSQHFQWSHWRRWTTAGELYLLRGSGSVFTFIPARAFGSPDEERAFRSLLERHLAGGGRERGAAMAGAAPEA